MRHVIIFLLTAIPAQAEVPSVVTDIAPVQSLVAQVMGDLGAPDLLLAKGADEHDFQLRPSQAGAVADAGLVVWIGPELTPWLAGALETRPEGAAALALLEAEGTTGRTYGEAGPDAEGTVRLQGDGPAAKDPHAWLDPDNGQLWLRSIADELGRLDPENAAAYQANAVAAADRIKALDVELAAALAPVKNKPLVTYHDAFGYFADHFGLALAGSVALGDASSPGAARLARLRADLAAGGVVCVFPEVQSDPTLLTQLAEGTAVKIGGALDSVGSSLEPGPGAYAALLMGLAQTIAECAGGEPG